MTAWRLGLRGRLGLAFGALLALQAVTVGVALWQLQVLASTHAQSAALVAVRELAMDWSAQTRLNVQRAILLAKAGSPPALATYVDGAMKKTSSDISAVQQQLEKRLSTPEERALTTQVAEARKAYLAIRSSILAQLGQEATAAQAQTDVEALMMPAANRYLAGLDAVVSGADAKVKQQDQMAARQLEQVTTTLAVLSAVALVLAVAMAWLMARSLVLPVRQAIDTARRIAGGDLSSSIAATRSDELGELQQALGQMQQQLRGIVAGIRSGSESLSVATEQIATGNQDLSSRTERTAGSLQEAAANVGRLTDTMRQSAGSADTANRLAGSAVDLARRGGQVVAEVKATMGDINASSSRIAEITAVIDGIAFQTNILALNAAVEAARAGEQGRGFAVVAGEVRSLAQRSAEAAREIKGLIGASTEKVEAGTRLANDAGEAMDDIVRSVQRVTAAIAEISAAASAQTGSIGEVNDAIGELDRMTQQNAALVEEAAAAAHSLKDQAANLVRSAASFRVVAMA